MALPSDVPYGGLVAPPADPYAPIKAAAGAGQVAPNFTPASFTLPPVAAPASSAPPQSGGFEGSPAGQRIIGAESGNRNIPNYRYDPTHTAGGYFQITDTNWQHYAPQIGIDLKQYPNAMSAPENLQGQVAGKMYAETGIMPWSGNPALRGVAGAHAEQFQRQNVEIMNQSSDLARQQQELGRKFASLDVRDPASLKELAHYREKMEQYQEQALHLAMNPPSYNPRDGMQRMSSLAVIIGMLAGRFSKTPLIASLNAGAAAMDAEKHDDDTRYKIAMDQWKVSTDALLKMTDFEQRMYKDTLDDEKFTAGQKLDILRGQASMMNNQGMTLATIGNDLSRAQQYNERQMYYAERLQQLAARGAGTSMVGKAQAYEVTYPDGTTKEMSLEPGKRPGEWYDSATGAAVTFPEGTIPVPLSGSAGRQEATQINALIGSGNEAAADIKNLMELPISATTGLFAGVGRDARTTAEAWQRGFATMMTPEDAKDVRTSALGIQREMATIEAQGRATGLVGLQKLNDDAIPMVNDSGEVIMRKYAQIRQVVERNIQMVLARTRLDPKQRELLEKNLQEIKEAVPFTVHDVNEMKRRLQSGSPESVAEYATRMLGHGGLPKEAVDMLKEDPSAARKQQFDAVFGPGSADKALAQ
jgi:hypothetical protein